MLLYSTYEYWQTGQGNLIAGFHVFNRDT